MNQTNKPFAAEDILFIKACNLAGIEATKRQASRWQNNKGTAFKFKKGAIRELEKEQQK